MRPIRRIGALSLLCLLGLQQAHAQPPVLSPASSNDDTVPCQGLSVSVTAHSADDRRLACSGQERVLAASQASVSALTDGTPYARLPLRDFYKSLIVHEVVHGVMHQNLERKPETHAAYEYPAYALQIESLTPDVREEFLSSFDQDALESKALFNDSVLFFDPYFFAARAHRHFGSAPDGCTYLNALLSGAVTFLAPQM